VKRTFYPGLESHPEAALAARLLDGGHGAMVTIDVGSRACAEALIKNLAASIPFAPSLGDVQTTLSHPATTSHRGQDGAQLAAQGLTAGMVRISVGLEDADDLWSELRGALDGLGG
jgi:cystathionine beta-lyase/cystathionine gamma-synthase